MSQQVIRVNAVFQLSAEHEALTHRLARATAALRALEEEGDGEAARWKKAAEEAEARCAAAVADKAVTEERVFAWKKQVLHHLEATAVALGIDTKQRLYEDILRDCAMVAKGIAISSGRP